MAIATRHPCGDQLEVIDLRDDLHLQVVELNASPRALEHMDTLYRHGFGNHLPMRPSDHRNMVNNGTVIGLFNDEDRLVAMRALLPDWGQSIPLDPPSVPEHGRFAYSNHSIIDRNYRGTAVASILVEHTYQWLKRINRPGLRVSVAPDNYRSIGYLTKFGFRMVDHVPNLYGAGEHRFHGVWEIDNPNTAYQRKNEIKEALMKENGDTTSESDVSHDTKYVAVQLIGTVGTNQPNNFEIFNTLLNEQGYEGVLIAPWAGQENVLVCRRKRERIR